MLPSERLPMPPQWRDLLEQVAPAFRRRSTFRLFAVLACGLILADRGTVTGMAAAAGIAHRWRRACWFFAGAAWDPGELGIAVARLIVKFLLRDSDPLTAAVDGTFFRRWGRHVAEARWAYDGSAQGGKKIAFGNAWVILALVVQLPFCPSPVALPVLFRLWRGKGTASQVELAAELMTALAAIRTAGTARPSSAVTRPAWARASLSSARRIQPASPRKCGRFSPSTSHYASSSGSGRTPRASRHRGSASRTHCRPRRTPSRPFPLMGTSGSPVTG
jgi:hypothetical protein